MVVDDVLNYDDPAAMTFADEMAIFVPSAGARLDTEMVGTAVAPTGRATKLSHREQFDGVDP